MPEKRLKKNHGKLSGKRLVLEVLVEPVQHDLEPPLPYAGPGVAPEDVAALHEHG